MTARCPAFRRVTTCVVAKRMLASVAASAIVCEDVYALRLVRGMRPQIRSEHIEAWRSVISACIYHMDFRPGDRQLEVCCSSVRLADDANVHIRTLYRVLRELHCLGWVELEYQYDHAERRFNPTRVFLMPAMFKRFGFTRDDVQAAVTGMSKRRGADPDKPSTVRPQASERMRQRLNQIRMPIGGRIRSARMFIASVQHPDKKQTQAKAEPTPTFTPHQIAMERYAQEMKVLRLQLLEADPEFKVLSPLEQCRKVQLQLGPPPAP